MSKKFSWIIMNVVIICMAIPAIAHAAERHVITERYMPATPADVLQAFVDDEDLKTWWNVSRTLIEPKVGGVWSVSWDDWGEEKTQHSWSGVIGALSDRKLVVTGMVMNEPDMPLFGPMRLQIEVAASDGGSLVTVTHSGYGYGGHWDEIYAPVVAGWDHVLGDMQEWFQQKY